MTNEIIKNATPIGIAPIAAFGNQVIPLGICSVAIEEAGYIVQADCYLIQTENIQENGSVETHTLIYYVVPSDVLEIMQELQKVRYNLAEAVYNAFIGKNKLIKK